MKKKAAAPSAAPKEAPVIVVLSDLHVGSTKGLLPDGYVNVEGAEVNQNAIQQWLWSCWLDAREQIGQIIGGRKFALVINGDAIEGVHHGTKEIWSTEIGDHALAAVQLLAPLANDADRVFMVRGTESHVNNHEASIGAKLGGDINPELGIAAFDRLTLDVHGVRCVFRHHIGTTMRRGLAGSQLSLSLAEEQLEAAANGEKVPQVIVCSHRHKPGVYSDNNGMCIVTPAWQVLTRFGHKVVSAARCTPGFQILDWQGKNTGELPHVHSRYYQAPQPKAIVL
jgi:hypothetical protein